MPNYSHDVSAVIRELKARPFTTREFLEQLHGTEDGKTFFILPQRRVDSDIWRDQHFHPTEIELALSPAWSQLGKSGRETYVTWNRFYKPRRKTENVKWLCATVVDLDYYDVSIDGKTKVFEGETPSSITIRVLRDLWYMGMPEPSVVIGAHGVQLAWIYDRPVPAKYFGEFWRELQKKVAERLSGYGADQSVCDLPRVTRLPGSVNVKTKRPVRVIWASLADGSRNVRKHSFSDIYSAFTGHQPSMGSSGGRRYVRRKARKESVTSGSFQGYWKGVYADIMRLVDKFRGAVPEGMRDLCLFHGMCAACHAGMVASVEEFDSAAAELHDRIDPSWRESVGSKLVSLRERFSKDLEGETQENGAPWVYIASREKIAGDLGITPDSGMGMKILGRERGSSIRERKPATMSRAEYCRNADMARAAIRVELAKDPRARHKHLADVVEAVTGHRYGRSRISEFCAQVRGANPTDRSLERTPAENVRGAINGGVRDSASRNLTGIGPGGASGVRGEPEVAVAGGVDVHGSEALEVPEPLKETLAGLEVSDPLRKALAGLWEVLLQQGVSLPAGGDGRTPSAPQAKGGGKAVTGQEEGRTEELPDRAAYVRELPVKTVIEAVTGRPPSEEDLGKSTVWWAASGKRGAFRIRRHYTGVWIDLNVHSGDPQKLSAEARTQGGYGRGNVDLAAYLQGRLEPGGRIARENFGPVLDGVFNGLRNLGVKIPPEFKTSGRKPGKAGEKSTAAVDRPT